MRTSATSLNPPSMSKAAASARRFHPEDTESRIVGNQLTRPDRVDEFGRESDAGLFSKVRLRPLRMALTESPGRRPCACAKPSLAITSSGAPRIDIPATPQDYVVEDFHGGGPGMETRHGPVAGSSMPSTSSTTSTTTRVSACETPGIAAIRFLQEQGSALERRKHIGEALSFRNRLLRVS